MATISKRAWTTATGESKSAWRAAYIDQAGKRRTKQFATKKAADVWMVQARHEVSVGTHLADSNPATVADAAAKWLARCEARGLEPTTLESYEQRVRLHILPELGSVRLSRLTEDRVADFQDHLLKTISRAMVAKVMVNLRSILRQAKRPIDVRLDREPGRHKRKSEVGKDIPTPEQVAATLTAATGQRRAILALAALAGLRASEIRGLMWRDIDLKAGEITVRQRADKWGVIGSPKSADARRTVPIGSELVRALTVWKLACPPGDLVFPSRSGTPLLLSNLRRDVIGPVQLHRLRHFYASWQLAQGVPLTVVQRRMGHSTITLTANLYSHLLPSTSDERAALAAAERTLFGH